MRFLGAFAYSRKGHINLVISARPFLCVCLFTCTISTPTGWVFVKFVVVDFYHNVSIKFRFA